MFKSGSFFSGSESGPAACVDAAGVSGGAPAEQWHWKTHRRNYQRGTGEGERHASKEERHSGCTAKGKQSTVRGGQKEGNVLYNEMNT